MAGRRATNRAMFWRIIRRLLGANRGRLFVILLALGAGAAVTAALLNLQVDAKRRLTVEFRAFGPNAVIVPREDRGSLPVSATLDDSILSIVVSRPHGKRFIGIPALYVVSNVRNSESKEEIPAVVVGTQLDLIGFRQVGWKLVSKTVLLTQASCLAGTSLAAHLQLKVGSRLLLRNGDSANECVLAGILSTGGPEDGQLFVDLGKAQNLAQLPRRLSIVQLIIEGSPSEIQNQIAVLRNELPQAEVRPIRQFTEGEARIYNRISGLLTATVGIVLLFTALCVMAAMTNVAMERKMDVGLMKAIGGATRRVLRLFLVESALLGLSGGLIGAAAGIFLSIGLGKAVFGVAARPRLIVYPVSVALTVIVAILSAFPLRRLASIRPASIFRGEA